MIEPLCRTWGVQLKVVGQRDMYITSQIVADERSCGERIVPNDTVVLRIVSFGGFKNRYLHN